MTKNKIFFLFVLMLITGCNGSSTQDKQFSGTSSAQKIEPVQERKPDADQVKKLNEKLSICFEDHWKPTFANYPKKAGSDEDRKAAMYMTTGLVLDSCLGSYFNIEELKIMTDAFEKKLNLEIDLDLVAEEMILASWKE